VSYFKEMCVEFVNMRQGFAQIVPKELKKATIHLRRKNNSASMLHALRLTYLFVVGMDDEIIACLLKYLIVVNLQCGACSVEHIIKNCVIIGLVADEVNWAVGLCYNLAPDLVSIMGQDKVLTQGKWDDIF